MNNKEKILEEWLYNSPHIRLREAVGKAMDIYAEEQSISFSEWKQIQGYKMTRLDNDGTIYWGTEDNRFYTTKELYKIFLKEGEKEK